MIHQMRLSFPTPPTHASKPPTKQGLPYAVLGAGGPGDELALYRSMSTKYVPLIAAPACPVSRVFTSGVVRHHALVP